MNFSSFSVCFILSALFTLSPLSSLWAESMHSHKQEMQCHSNADESTKTDDCCHSGTHEKKKCDHDCSDCSNSACHVNILTLKIPESKTEITNTFQPELIHQLISYKHRFHSTELVKQFWHPPKRV